MLKYAVVDAKPTSLFIYPDVQLYSPKISFGRGANLWMGRGVAPIKTAPTAEQLDGGCVQLCLNSRFILLSTRQ